MKDTFGFKAKEIEAERDQFYESIEAGDSEIIYRDEIVQIYDHDRGWTYLWREREFRAADEVLSEIDQRKSQNSE